MSDVPKRKFVVFGRSCNVGNIYSALPVQEKSRRLSVNPQELPFDES